MNTNLPETDVAIRARTLRATAQLALDALMQKPIQGIPIWLINPMEWRMIDRIAGEPEGTYKPGRRPDAPDTPGERLLRQKNNLVSHLVSHLVLCFFDFGIRFGTRLYIRKSHISAVNAYRNREEDK